MFRDLKNNWIAGVCAGMARRFGCSALLVRLCFMGSILLCGVGLPLAMIAYLVLWLVLAPEPQAQ